MSSDPMLDAMIEIGTATDWGVDIVQVDGRTLVVDGETNLVIGEILSGGIPTMFDNPKPYEGEENQ